MFTNKVSPYFRLQDSFLSFNVSTPKEIDVLNSGHSSTLSGRNLVFRDSEKGIHRRAFITTPTSRSPLRNKSPRPNKDPVMTKLPTRSASMPKIGVFEISQINETKLAKILSNSISPIDSHDERGPQNNIGDGEIKLTRDPFLSARKSAEASFQLPKVRISPDAATLNIDEGHSTSKQRKKETWTKEGQLVSYLNFLKDSGDPSDLKEFRSRLSKQEANKNKAISRELQAMMKHARKSSLLDPSSQELIERRRRSSISPVVLKNDLIKNNEVTLFGRNLSLARKDRRKHVLFGIHEGDLTTKQGASTLLDKSVTTQTNEHMLIPLQGSPVSNKFSKQNDPFSNRSSVYGQNDFSHLKRSITGLSFKKMPDSIYETSKPIEKKLAKDLAYNLHTLASTNLNEKTVEALIHELANKDTHVLAFLEAKSHRIYDYDNNKLTAKFSSVRVLNEGICLLDWKTIPPLIDINTLKKVKIFLEALDGYNTMKKVENLKALEDMMIKSCASTISSRKNLLRKIGDKSEKAMRIHQEMHNLHGTVNLQHLQAKDISKRLERHEIQNGEVREVFPRNRIISSKLQDLVQNYLKFSLENAWGIGK